MILMNLIPGKMCSGGEKKKTIIQNRKIQRTIFAPDHFKNRPVSAALHITKRSYCLTLFNSLSLFQSTISESTLQLSTARVLQDILRLLLNLLLH